MLKPRTTNSSSPAASATASASAAIRSSGEAVGGRVGAPVAPQVERDRARPGQVELLDRRVEVAPRARPAVHAQQVRRPLTRGLVGDRGSVIGHRGGHDTPPCGGTLERTYASAAANASASAIASGSVSAAPCACAPAHAASPSAADAARTPASCSAWIVGHGATPGPLPDRLLGAVQPGRAEEVTAIRGEAREAVDADGDAPDVVERARTRGAPRRAARSRARPRPRAWRRARG